MPFFVALVACSSSFSFLFLLSCCALLFSCPSSILSVALLLSLFSLRVFRVLFCSLGCSLFFFFFSFRVPFLAAQSRTFDPFETDTGRLSSRDRDLEAYGLKMFLEKVADNLVLRRSEKLRHFLEDNTEMFHEVLEQSKAVAESRKRSFKSGFMRGLKKFGSLFRKKQEGDVSRLTEPESEAVDYASSVKKSLNKIFKRTAALAQAQSSASSLPAFLSLSLSAFASLLSLSCVHVSPSPSAEMGMCMEEVAASIKAFDVYEPQSVLKSMWKQTEECICTTSNAVEAAVGVSLSSPLALSALLTLTPSRRLCHWIPRWETLPSTSAPTTSASL